MPDPSTRVVVFTAAAARTQADRIVGRLIRAYLRSGALQESCAKEHDHDGKVWCMRCDALRTHLTRWAPHEEQR